MKDRIQKLESNLSSLDNTAINNALEDKIQKLESKLGSLDNTAINNALQDKIQKLEIKVGDGNANKVIDTKFTEFKKEIEQKLDEKVAALMPKPKVTKPKAESKKTVTATDGIVKPKTIRRRKEPLS